MLAQPATKRMLAAFTAAAQWASLHAVDPDEDQGATESQAVRQLVQWAEPVDGRVETSAALEWTVPAGEDVAFVGYWTTRYGGVYLGSRPLSEPALFGVAGAYRVPAGMVVEEIVSG